MSNLYFISKILYKRYKNFFLLRLLGQWQDIESGIAIPEGGFLISCGLFAKTSIELSGKSSRDLARQLRDNNHI